MLKFLSKAAPAIALAALCLGHPVYAQDTVTAPLDATTPSSGSEIEDINKALEALSQELLLSLPPAGTYAIKSANDTTSGVPEDLLTQITSSLQSSIMIASDFQITIIDQAQLQEAWAGAVEFNGADFENLVANANFEALIVIHTRATETSVELSLQAVGATSENAGQTIASTSIKSINLDWKKLSGIDIEGIDETIEEIKAKLSALEDEGKVIESPSNWLEFYSNSKRYAEDRNIDAALNSLENALLGKPEFFDPAFDFAKLVRAKYGTSNATKFVQKRIAGKIRPDHETVIMMLLGEAEISYPDIVGPDGKFSNAVVAAVWFWGEGQTILAKRDADFSKASSSNISYSSYEFDFYLLGAIRTVIEADISGSLGSLFYDIKVQNEILRVSEMEAIEQKINRVEYQFDGMMYDYGFSDLALEHNGIWKAPAGPVTLGEVIKLKPIQILSRAWYEIDWSGFASDNPWLSFGTKSCGVDFCALDNFVNGGLSQQCNAGTQSSVLDETIDIEIPELIEMDFSTSEYTEYASNLFDERSPYIPPRYADLCILVDTVMNGGLVRKEKDGYFWISGPANLLITDSVDIQKPIIATFGTKWALGGETNASLTLDISKDGSYVYKKGFPLATSREEDSISFNANKFAGGWFYIPGFVEGALLTGPLEVVTYTDTLGRVKTVSNVYVAKGSYTDQFYLPAQQLSFVRINGIRSGSYGDDYENPKSGVLDGSPFAEVIEARPFDDENIGSENTAPESYENSSSVADFSTLGTCVNWNDSAFYPTNIDEYVSLRSDPSTDANILRKVFKGEKLEAADTYTYFGANSPTARQCYDLCKAESETGRINTSNLAMCIDDNSLWLKLRTSDGIEGYISTKFLGVPTSDFSSSEGGAYEEGD